MVSVVAFRTLWLISSALYTVADPLKMVCCLKVLSLVLLQSSLDCFFSIDIIIRKIIVKNQLLTGERGNNYLDFSARRAKN